MLRFLKQINGERGQALLMVLVLLVLAGLMINPTLGHAANTMISTRTIERNVKGLYAAEAGVKYALCNLEPGTHQLTEKVNQMEVTVEVESIPEYTYALYSGELMRGGQHSNWLSVDSEIVADKYTITVGWQAEPGTPEIHLKEIGGKLPLGYIYQSGSAAEFDDNLSNKDPDEFEDAAGAYMVNWKLESPLPSISETNPVKTQTFCITGEGDPENYYAWVVAGVTGEVSEISGTLYIITATARCPESEEPTGIIVCDVLVEHHKDGTPDTKNIISWEVLK